MVATYSPSGERIGRPLIHGDVDDPVAVEMLCDHLAMGFSMKRACLEPGVPEETAVYKRMRRDEAFRALIAQARVVQQIKLVDDMIDMADAATVANWQVVRMRIWARQWHAVKLAPMIYGETSTVNVKTKRSAPTVVLTTTDPIEAARAYQRMMTGDGDEADDGGDGAGGDGAGGAGVGFGE